jgi:AcrR family transcriptional regulator
MARPQKPIISRERAAAAALSIIDDAGLSSFGLQQVAKELGVKAPSLYYHFKDKAEILSEVAQLLFVEGRLPPLKRGQDWREAIVQIAIASRRSILRHPNAAPLLLQFFPRHLLIDAYEHWLKIFDLNEVPVESHLLILEGAEKLTYGSALFSALSHSRGQSAFPEYEAEQHPYIAAATRSNPWDEESLFVETLRAFLRGVPIPK